ncbi:MAG TPA: hypothetical protein VGT41_01730 [Candidatus Babeliales bacterium]|nr:hypothetical protein [Candidatus Babeliales bacterium]
MKKFVLLVLAALFLNVPLHAVFYNLTVLRNKNTGQLIFSLADIHVDAVGGENTIAQRKDLISMVSGLKGKGESVHCLIEDVKSAASIDWNPEYESNIIWNVNKDKSWAQQLASDAGKDFLESITEEKAVDFLGMIIECLPMRYLVLQLWAYGISCKNIESRMVFYEFISKNKIPWGDFKLINMRAANEKEQKGMDALYRIMIMQTVNSIKSSDIKEKLLRFLYTYPVLDASGMQNSWDDVMKNEYFMVDIAAIDDIYQHADVHNIFLCAGGAHNEKINEFLLSTGEYDQVRSFGQRINFNARVLERLRMAFKPPYPLNLRKTFDQVQRAIAKFEKALKVAPEKGRLKSKL